MSLITAPASSVQRDSIAFRRMQWRMLLAVMFCYAFYYTGRQNFGWAAAALISDLGFTPTDVGLINGGMLLFYGIGQAVNGNLGDSLGARILMTAGAVLSCALNWATSFTHTAGTMLATWSANGYAQSLGFAPGGRLISNWWEEKERGRAFGFYLLAAGISSVLTYALCISILTVLGWRYVFRIPVMFLLTAGIVFACIARNSPREAGMAADTTTIDKGGDPGWFDRYASLAGNWRFMLACLTIGFESTARYGLLTWTPLVYLGPEWKRQPFGLWITLALPAGMALGAWTCGYISDRFFNSNRSRPIALFLGMAAVCSVALYCAPAGHVVAGTTFLFLSGFFVFGPQSTLWALCPDLLGRTRTGTSIGVMDACAYGFAAAGEPLYGLAIQISGDSSIVFLLTTLFCGLGSAAIIAVRR